MDEDLVSYYGPQKRDPYAFGLGKRDLPTGFLLRQISYENKRDPYAFGLGR